MGGAGCLEGKSNTLLGGRDGLISAQQGANSSVVFNIQNLYEYGSTTTCDGSTTPYDDATYFINYFAYPWSTCNWAENWLVANDTNYYLQLTIPNWQHFSLPPGEGGLAAREPLAPDSLSTCREQACRRPSRFGS